MPEREFLLRLAENLVHAGSAHGARTLHGAAISGFTHSDLNRIFHLTFLLAFNTVSYNWFHSASY